MKSSIDKKIIVITGCSTGIGLCAALTLHEKNYHVIATVRKEEDKQYLISQGLPDVVIMDLANSDSIAAAVSHIKAISQGKLYALFNNGAYGQPGAVEDLSRDTLRKQFETNVFGTHELTTQLLPELLMQKTARIIQNSSVLGFAAMPMRGAYNASKFALEGLTDTLRLELLNTNVRISIIEPGPITSHFRVNAVRALEANIDVASSRFEDGYKAALERLKKEGPASRFTLPADAVVKKVIHALESPRSRERYYVTLPTYVFAGLRHVLPTFIMDKILSKLG